MANVIAFSKFGPPSVLEVIEVDEPQAVPGHIRVRVKAAGVNPFDSKLRRGDLVATIPPNFPQKIGNEFSGVVDQVGNGVSDFEIGGEVLGFTFASAYAEFVVVPPAQVTTKPSNMGWADAGALSVAGQTAYHALQDLHVTAGETLLIHGASGGVGTVAVQLARAAGATVIGTASPENHEYLRSLGAIPVNYGDGLVSNIQAMTSNRIDVALDLAGGEAIHASLALIADKNRIGTVVDEKAAEKHQVRRLRPAKSAQTLAGLALLHSRGELQMSISATYPLEQAAAAHHELEAGHRPGKIVLLTP